MVEEIVDLVDFLCFPYLRACRHHPPQTSLYTLCPPPFALFRDRIRHSFSHLCIARRSRLFASAFQVQYLSVICPALT